MTAKKRISKKKSDGSMPPLIFQNTKTETSIPEKIIEKPIFKPQYNPTVRSAKFWLWSGVGIFSLMILILWGWAMKIRLDAFSWQKTPEKKIVETAKTDWDTYFTETKTLEENKNKIKNVLNQIMVSIISTTTVSTSTITTTSTKTK
jgi:hypothetical protein